MQARRQSALRQRCPLMAVALKPAGATLHSSRRVGPHKAEAAAATPQQRLRHCSPFRAAGRLPQPAATAAARRPPGAPRLLRRRLAPTARATDRAVRPRRRRFRSPRFPSSQRHLTSAWGCPSREDVVFLRPATTGHPPRSLSKCWPKQRLDKPLKSCTGVHRGRQLQLCHGQVTCSLPCDTNWHTLG